MVHMCEVGTRVFCIFLFNVAIATVLLGNMCHDLACTTPILEAGIAPGPRATHCVLGTLWDTGTLNIVICWSLEGSECSWV